MPESEYDSESKMVALESCCLNLGSDAESISVATRPGRDPKKGSVPDCVPDCNPCVNNSAEACVPNVPLAGTMQQVGCYIYFVGRSRNCFSMKVPIRLSNGVEVIAHVLVDDGAALVLFGSGFIDDIGDQLWQKPEQKVNLVVANQTLLGGGSRECSLDLKFLCQRFDGRFSGTKYFSTFAYEADINFDIYIGNPLLFDHKIAPFAHRGIFFHDQGEGCWLWPWRESPPALMDYVSEYCPAEMQESLRNSLVDKPLAGKSLSAVQALGELDLEPYVPELDMARPPTKQQFFSSVAAEKKRDAYRLFQQQVHNVP